MINIDHSNSPAVREIERHNQAVRRPRTVRVCYRKSCARAAHPGRFAPHELRCRGLRLNVNHTVLCLTTWLARWRCRNCRYVFTDYPDFRTAL